MGRDRQPVLERFGFRLVPRRAVPGYLVFFVSVGAIVAAIIVTGFIFWAYGVNPFAAAAFFNALIHMCISF